MILSISKPRRDGRVLVTRLYSNGRKIRSLQDPETARADLAREREEGAAAAHREAVRRNTQSFGPRW